LSAHTNATPRKPQNGNSGLALEQNPATLFQQSASHWCLLWLTALSVRSVGSLAKSRVNGRRFL